MNYDRARPHAWLQDQVSFMHGYYYLSDSYVATIRKFAFVYKVSQVIVQIQDNYISFYRNLNNVTKGVAQGY